MALKLKIADIKFKRCKKAFMRANVPEVSNSLVSRALIPPVIMNLSPVILIASSSSTFPRGGYATPSRPAAR